MPPLSLPWLKSDGASRPLPLRFPTELDSTNPKLRMAQVEVIKVASVKYQIDRISTEDEDCWRDIDEERLQEIKTNIKDGNWGASVLQFARLAGDEDGKIIPSSHNGLPKVLDGNHIVRVLVGLKNSAIATPDDQMPLPDPFFPKPP